MIIYLVRHGQDDDTYRGGWSNHALTSKGIQQSENLAIELYNNKNKYNITKIYSSDLIRAQQTAKILADKIDIPIHFMSEFREVNNGDLAGLKNEIANIKFPNLYWRKLEWDKHYPNGESPKEFYERIKSAWNKLIKSEKTIKAILFLLHTAKL
ncbi:MAG: histidine phosphatase family protein [Eubacterium sp.]|nr:histidine phosphatase family protein [Eubacterium sp.]